MIEAANAAAHARYLEADPVLTGIGPALEVLPGMDERTILHAGPPVAWEAMCGPMKGAVLGAILFEGWGRRHRRRAGARRPRRGALRAVPSP